MRSRVLSRSAPLMAAALLASQSALPTPSAAEEPSGRASSTGTLHGRVLDPDGHPVAGATVYTSFLAGTWWAIGEYVTTDASGEYSFEARLPLKLVLHGCARGLSCEYYGGTSLLSKAEILSVTTPSALPDLVLERGGSVAGTIELPSSGPRVSVQTRLFALDDHGGFEDVTSDFRPNGTSTCLRRDDARTSIPFSYRGLPPGHYAVGSMWDHVDSSCSNRGAVAYQGGALHEFEVGQGEAVTGVRLPVARPHRLRGRVLDPQGLPVAGVPVRARWTGPSEHEVGTYGESLPTSDEQGRFSLYPLAPGPYRLDLAGPPPGRPRLGPPPPSLVEVTNASNPVLDLPLARGAVVSGTLVFPPGVRHRGFVAGSWDNVWPEWWSRPTRDGDRFTIPNVPRGTWTLRAGVWDTWFYDGTREVSVDRGTVDGVRLVLKLRRGIVTGAAGPTEPVLYAVDSAGELLPGRPRRIIPGSETYRAAVVPGTYKVRFEAFDGQGRWFGGTGSLDTARVIEVKAGVVTSGVSYARPDGRVRARGRLLAANGDRTSTSLRVQAFEVGSGRRVSSLLVDGDSGIVSFDGLPPGTYRLRVATEDQRLRTDLPVGQPWLEHYGTGDWTWIGGLDDDGRPTTWSLQLGVPVSLGTTVVAP